MYLLNYVALREHIKRYCDLLEIGSCKINQNSSTFSVNHSNNLMVTMYLSKSDTCIIPTGRIISLKIMINTVENNDYLTLEKSIPKRVQE